MKNRSLCGVAFALLAGGLLTACAPTALTPVTSETTRGPKISLLPTQSGMAAIAVRVVDQRKGYGTQGVWNVDDFEEVRISVHSPQMLPQPRVDSLPRNEGQTDYTYNSDILRGLPPSNDYKLLVALANDNVIVGQGGVNNIALTPGQVKSVTVYINAIGQAYFVSDEYEVRGELYGMHDYFTGLIEGSTVRLQVSVPWDPTSAADQQVTKVAMDIYDELTETVAVASDSAFATLVWEAGDPESPRYGEFTFQLPALEGNDAWQLYRSRFYALNANGQVLSTKTPADPFYLMRGATITVDLE